MADAKWFDAYGGETTERLLELADEYRIDSLVVAFEEALQQKAASGTTSREERYVLAVEALEREVNNGGYGQFFLNSSREFIDVVEEALVAIGCPQCAAITHDAIAALGVRGEVTGEKAEVVALANDRKTVESFERCDERYHDNDEPIADRLFAWIDKHRTFVRVGEG